MASIIGKAIIAGGGTAKRLEFSYSGIYNERLDDGVVELLSSGTLVVTRDALVDLFLVGAGGGGHTGYGNNTGASGGGAGGGYTKTVSNVSLHPNTDYSVVIGAGGSAATAGTSRSKGTAGGATSITVATTTYSAGGGQVGDSFNYGGNGGSGGGSSGGTGGSDGSNGAGGNYTNGRGQGTTTREFGEATGKLYAGGGNGGTTGSTNPGASGGANTGDGGSGSPANESSIYRIAGSGGSGIVCIRLHKE